MAGRSWSKGFAYAAVEVILDLYADTTLLKGNMTFHDDRLTEITIMADDEPSHFTGRR